VSLDGTETLPGPSETDPGLDVTEPSEPASSSEPSLGGPGAREAPVESHRSKFLVVYAVLGAIVAFTAIGLVVLLGRPDAAPKQAWSAWKPAADDPVARAQEIGNEVGASYRLPSGAQLVYVQAEAPQVQNIPVAAVAIRSAPGGDTFTGEGIPVFPADETMVYILCGLGNECSIDEGEPTPERQRLLRREALELALYTFRYIDDVNNVVAFMPPRAGYRPSYALFFQRPELEALLDRPLRQTLPQAPPPLPAEISPAEVDIIDGLTEPRFFAFAFQQLQDGQAVMVLEDPRRVPPPQPIDTTQTDATGDLGGTTEPGATTEPGQADGATETGG
jgi:hypothetical protein